MSHVTNPANTPNVVISNPKVRQITNVVLGVAGTILTLAVIVDLAIPEIDYSFITTPATQIVLGVAALFGLAVTTPNVPKNA